MSSARKGSRPAGDYPPRLFVLDRVLDVLDLGHRQRAVHHQADHVDPAGLLLAMRLRAIQLEEHAQFASLALVDGLLGGPETGATPRLDLDDHERLAVLGDDVDLPEAAAPVARED